MVGHADDGNKGSAGRKARQARRDKDHAADGSRYDRRKGDYGRIDAAVLREGEILNDWLTPEWCEVELDILNRGKRGRRYLYPPSLVLYLLYLKEDSDRSYRRAVSGMQVQLRLKGLPVPTYSTLHQAEERFFGKGSGGLGARVVEEAMEVLRSRGREILLDPLMTVGTGVHPGFAAPRKIPVCAADVEMQEAADAEAAGLAAEMEVVVLKAPLLEGRERTAAVDGSGEGISGPGIYIEHIWNLGDRGFVKQHAMVDTVTQEPLAVAVTLEKPGDCAVFPFLVRAATDAGMKLKKVLADAAYDSVDNWKVAGSCGFEYVPNLRKNFGRRRDLPARNDLLALEGSVGKKAAHIATGYNARWLVEAFFSVIKKLYGEKVRSRLFGRMAMTIRRRYALCSLHKRLYAAARGYGPG